jgi:predicted nucleic acid-binding protein
MAGNVFDLADPDVRLPEFFLLDTNVVCERFLAELIPALPQPQVAKAQRAVDLFQRLEDEHTVGLITPIIYSELMHVAIKLFFQQQALRQTPKTTWLKLFKSHPTLIRDVRTVLEQLCVVLRTSRLVMISPEELGKIDAGTTYDYRLIELCWTYSLDTGDAGILLEAERLGVDSIVTMDADFRRAQTSFDIYTWI